MLSTYEVYANGKHIVDVVASSAQSACKQAYMVYGGASAYTGYSKDSFTAIKKTGV